MAAWPITSGAGGVRLTVMVTPKASRNRVMGVVGDADGNSALKVSVTAAPEDGKANAALVRLLAKALGVPKSSLSIVAGATSRRKTVLAAGDPVHLEEKFGSVWEGIDG